MEDFFKAFNGILSQYNTYIFVFVTALFLAITFAHPAVLVTDEWITINQLSQLHDGHQLIYNEGKYGLAENVTDIQYLFASGNYLAYPLFLSVISFPAYWIIDFFGKEYVFPVLYVWTFLLIAIALMTNSFFKEYTCIRNVRWTTGLIITTFILFCINLSFYRPFPVSGEDGTPEILAIVSTNIVLFALLSVMVYDTCLSIFHDTGYSIFGTVVCISCSSLLFWTNFCKDHALVAFLFTGIVFMIMRFLRYHQFRYPAAAFILTGLLAWARPEIGALIFITLCVLILYFVIIAKYPSEQLVYRNPLLIAPLFTLIGAIPFFLNNYLFTKNFLVPAWILWKTESPSAVPKLNDSVTISPTTPDTFGSLTHLFLSTIHLNPATVLSDVYGVLLNPQSGSIGLLPLVPLFLVTLLLLPVFWMIKKTAMSRDERDIIIALTLLALGVFLAYARGISGMNTSYGIVPDMRYMSPIYLPLNLLGLLAIRKFTTVSDNPRQLLMGMGAVWMFVLPCSLIIMAFFYPAPESWAMVFIYLNTTVSIAIFLVVILFIFSIILNVFYKISPIPAKIFMVILCALPFIWQIDAIFLSRLWAMGLGGYSFWIPIMHKLFGILF